VRMSIARATFHFRSAPLIWVFHDVADAAWFERCIDEISSTRDVVPLAELACNRTYRKACAITFDDGLRSVLDVAHPILTARQLPYTVFVCTEVLTGGPVPWFLRVAHLTRRVGLDGVRERWKPVGHRVRTTQQLIIALKQIPLDVILERLGELEERHSVSPPDPRPLFLSAADVKALSATGATIGSHTHRHPVLAVLDVHQQTFEVEESVKLIESVAGTRPTEFAYPNGTPLDFDATTIAVLRRFGIRFAVTTIPRYLSHGDDALALPRIGLDQHDSSVRRVLKNVAPSLSMSALRERRRVSR
jgi:peptidoglycan/xylan/chitin deacetylase (PgdA/CDA1 family)